MARQVLLCHKVREECRKTFFLMARQASLYEYMQEEMKKIALNAVRKLSFMSEEEFDDAVFDAVE